MNFYEIELNEFPKMEFVHSVERNNYSNRFPNIHNLLEITLCLGGNVVFLYDNNTKKIFKPDMIAVITKDTVCRTFTEKSEIHKHITIAVTMPQTIKSISAENLTFTDFSSLEKRIAENKSILLPNFVDLGAKSRIVENMISRAHTFFHSPNPADKINCLSIWLELCGFLTQFSLKKIRQLFSKNLPSDERYIDYALQYINAHLCENIRIEELAKEIGISQGYLQNIFKRITDFTIIEYINREKIKLVKSYTSGNRMTLATASKLVGIEDCSYMSRLFKKVTGISFSKFKKLNDRTIK